MPRRKSSQATSKPKGEASKQRQIAARPPGVGLEVQYPAQLPKFATYFREKFNEPVPRIAADDLGDTGHVLDGKELWVYQCPGGRYVMQRPQNETLSREQRLSADGNQLRYELEVCQQPDRARACGSGSKSQADRRPIDPPPVIRLNVFENGRDLTKGYDASFMLFASLELARPIAMAGNKATMHCPSNLPALTGSCVAGAAYLNKPKEGAYFIFPDVSVRHEGWYRLKFHLFEQTRVRRNAPKGWAESKVEEEEEYKVNAEMRAPSVPLPTENMNFIQFVYSVPFQVFSAKKFPGLIKSTPLSIEIASQGCRVRIRREIRARRGDSKKKAGDDDVPTPLAASQDEYSRQPSYDVGPSQYDQSRRSTTDATIMPSPLTLNTAQPIWGASTHTSPVSIPAFPPPMPVDPAPVSTLSRTGSITPVGPGGFPLHRPSVVQVPTPAYENILPPITNLASMVPPPTNPCPEHIVAPVGGYNTQPVHKKRCFNDRMNMPAPLKDHARPHLTPVPRRSMGVDALLNNIEQGKQQSIDQSSSPLVGIHSSILAADENEDDDGDNYSESSDDLLNNRYAFKRADGTMEQRMKSSVSSLYSPSVRRSQMTNSEDHC